MHRTWYTLRRKFFIQTIMIVVFVAGIGVGITQGITFIRDVFVELRQAELELRIAQDLSQNHTDAREALRLYVETGDKAQQEKYTEAFSLLSYEDSGARFSKLKQVNNLLQDMDTVGQEALGLVRRGEFSKAEDLYSSQYEALAGEIEVLLRLVLQERFDILGQRVSYIDALLPRAGNLVLWMVIFAAAFTALFSGFIIFPVVVRLRRLIVTMDRYAKGDLLARMTVDRGDEVGQLTFAFNIMSEKLASRTLQLQKLNEGLNEKVKERTKSLEAIIDSIREGVVVVDYNNRILRANALAAELVEVEHKDLDKAIFHEYFPMKIGDQGSFSLRELFSGGAKEVVLPADTELITRSGKVITVAGVASQIIVKDVMLGVVLVIRDVTSQRNLEKIRSEFASVASHQLRTPLSGIKWQSEILLRDASPVLPEALQGMVKGIHDSNERMIVLVENLLTAAKIDTQEGATLQNEQVDSGALIAEIIKELDGYVDNRSSDVILDIPFHTFLSVDREKIHEVFTNLISNAMKYSRQGRPVEVHLDQNQSTDQWAVFAVKDYGIGIPENEQVHIFEKFYRAKNATAHVTDGNGLGLYIVKALVTLHGGDVRYDTSKEGTTFYVKLPRSTS